MLERTSACLDSGVRLSLRTRRQIARSRRLLHSTFWAHGANDIEPPPWALTSSSFSSDQGAANSASYRPSKQPGNKPAESYPSDGVFLDFLYPPQTLAVLSRTVPTVERRSGRHGHTCLVNGNRGYSSLSSAPDEDGRPKQDASVRPAGDSGTKRWRTLEGQEVKESRERVLRNSEVSDDVELQGSASDDQQIPTEDYTAEEAVHEFNRILEEDKGRTASLRAWAVYESLDRKTRNDLDLRRRLLIWLADQNIDVAAERALQLFNHLEPHELKHRLYHAAVAAHLCLNDITRADRTFRKALTIYGTDHLCGADLLMEYAVAQRKWRLAVTVLQSYCRSADSSVNTPRVFQKVSQVANLQGSMQGLMRLVVAPSTPSNIAKDYQEILEGMCSRFIQHISRSADEVSAAKALDFLHRNFTNLQERSMGTVKLYETSLIALSKLRLPRQASRIYGLLSYIYRLYSKMEFFRPSIPLLASLLVAWKHDYLNATTSRSRAPGLRADNIVRDWKASHGKLDDSSMFLLMETFARRGETKLVERTAVEYRALHSDDSVEASRLWPLIYAHAVNKNGRGAQGQMTRMKQEFGVSPDKQCWNVLLYAYQRADDLPGAIEAFANMTRAKIDPDEYTFGPLLSMYGEAGDINSVIKLLKVADAHNVRSTTLMLNSKILAHVTNNDLEGAENALTEIVDEVKAEEATGSLTPCFNTLLTAHAMRRDLDMVMQVYRHMRDDQIPLDVNTYAALIASLCFQRQTNTAHKLLRQVMPAEGVRPNALHYAYIIAGYVNQEMYAEALEAHTIMTRSRIRDTVSTRMAYLKAKAMTEKKANKDLDHASQELHDTRQALNSILNASAPEFSGGPNPGLRATPPDQSISAYFSFLIFLHGSMQSFRAAKSLFQQYMRRVDAGLLSDQGLPMRLISAMMSVHQRLGEDEQVQRYWELARAEADKIREIPSPPLLPSPDLPSDQVSESPSGLDVGDSSDHAVSTDTELKVSTAASVRLMLSQPLRPYLFSLSTLQPPAINTMTTTVASLLSSGYTLDNRTWNVYLQLLCRSSPPRTLLTFTLCERFLMPNWAGWTHPRRTLRKSGVSPSRGSRAEGLEYIKKRYIAPGELTPQYATMVYLASALLEVRRRDATGLGRKTGRARRVMTDEERQEEAQVGTINEIRKRAPKTLEAVMNMPTVYDALQRRLIRSSDYRPTE